MRDPLVVMSGSWSANGLMSDSYLRLARLWFTNRCVDSSLRTA